MATGNGGRRPNGGGYGGAGGKGGGNNRPAGGNAAGTMQEHEAASSRMETLSDQHKRVLCDIFSTPVHHPNDMFDGLEHVPAIHEIYTISIPVSALEPTASSFASAMRMTPEYYHYQHLLSMVSMAITNPDLGTPIHIDVGNDETGVVASARPGAGPAALQTPVIVNGNDARGMVPDETKLMFTFRGQRMKRVMVYLEEVRDTADNAAYYTFWFFVYDKNYNFGQAIERVLEQNVHIYVNDGNVRPDLYVSHSAIHNVSHYVERVVRPYIEHGINNYMHPVVKHHYNMLKGSLRDTQAVLGLTEPLHSRDHLVHPCRIFNVASRFALLPNICLAQRRPENYFNMAHLEAPADVPIAATDNPAGGGGGGGDNDDDNELNLLLESMEDRAKAYAQPLHDPAQLPLAASTNESSGGYTPISKAVLDYLAEVPVSEFMGFAVPELVTRIDPFYFGRRLMRVPLPHVMKRLSASGEQLPSTDIGSNSEHYYREMSKKDTLERVSAMPLEQRRKEIDTLFENVDINRRMPITNEQLQNDQDYLDVLKQVRLIQLELFEEQAYERARADVVQWLDSTIETNYHGSGDDLLTRGYVFGGLLPENADGKISVPELRYFMNQYPLLKARLPNFLEKNRFHTTNDIVKDPEGFERNFRALCKRQGRQLWALIRDSEELPESDTTMRDWFFRLLPSEQWGEHLHLVANLSTYANLKLKQLSLYNFTFRGSVNQNVYMLAHIVYMACFYYDWGLRLHLLQLGRAAIGKSHVYECLETQAVPGSFEALGHVTAKQGTGNEIHVNKVKCMHEAPLAMIGVDPYGHEILVDPMIKDQMTRNRTMSKRATTDKDGIIVTVKYAAMHMTNSLFATNEIPPPEDSPIMTRYIVLTVNSMKRPDFNAAEANQPLIDLIPEEDKIQIHHAQLFAWYVYVTNKFIMAGVIPPVTTDACDILVKEILNKFTALTGISTSQPRKRKMVTDMMIIRTIEKAVHIGLFAPSSLAVSNPKNEETNKKEFVPFDPDMIIDRVMPHLYVDDEIVVDVLTLCAFMWEEEHRYEILNTIATKFTSLQTSPYHAPRFVVGHGYKFRMIQNPDYESPRSREQGFVAQHHLFEGRGQAQPNFAALTRPSMPSMTAAIVEESEEFIDTRSQFIEDPRYICVRGPSLKDIALSVVGRMKEDNLPSHNEIQRTFRDAATIAFKAHPVTIEFDDDDADDGADNDEASASQQHDEMVTDDFASDMDDLMIENAVALSGMAIRKAVRQTQNIQKAQLRGYERLQALRQRGARVKWVIHKDQPTTIERAVICGPNPMNPTEMQVCVLIEYLAEDQHHHAMLKAIQEVMSNNTVPQEGRRFITSLPYVHTDARAKPAVKEIMPQFLRTLNIKRREEQSLSTTFVNIGTFDSEAFTKSFVRNQHVRAPRNDYDIGDFMNTKLGLTFSPDMPLNTYCAWRHAMRCGFAPGSKVWYDALPDMVTNVNRMVMDQISRDPNANVTLIQTYPDDVVRNYLRRRMINDTSRISSEMRQKAFHTSSGIFHEMRRRGDIDDEAVNHEQEMKNAFKRNLRSFSEKATYINLGEYNKTARAVLDTKHALIDEMVMDMEPSTTVDATNPEPRQKRLRETGDTDEDPVLLSLSHSTKRARTLELVPVEKKKTPTNALATAEKSKSTLMRRIQARITRDNNDNVLS